MLVPRRTHRRILPDQERLRVRLWRGSSRHRAADMARQVGGSLDRRGNEAVVARVVITVGAAPKEPSIQLVGTVMLDGVESGCAQQLFDLRFLQHALEAFATARREASA